MSISSQSEHSSPSPSMDRDPPAQDQSLKPKRSHKVNPKYQEFFKDFEFGRSDVKSPAALKAHQSVQQPEIQAQESRAFQELTVDQASRKFGAKQTEASEEQEEQPRFADPERQEPEDQMALKRREKKASYKSSFSNCSFRSSKRSTRDCRKYSKNYQNMGVSNGRWTKEEHLQFLESIRLYGKDWRKIEEHVGTRTCSQIRSHAQKYFLRLEKENNFQENFDGTVDFSNSSVSNHNDPFIGNLSGKRKTDSQIAQIQHALQSELKESFQMKLETLRQAQIALQATKDLSPYELCKRLLILTQQLHEFSLECEGKKLQALAEEAQNERNKTHFTAIALAQKVTIENQKNCSENFEKNLREAVSKEGAFLFELIRERQAKEQTQERSQEQKVKIETSAFSKASPSVSDLALDSIRKASVEFMQH